jgi:hypothetical protein
MAPLRVEDPAPRQVFSQRNKVIDRNPAWKEAALMFGDIVEEAERTQPPVSTALRYQSPAELYADFPPIRDMIQLRPQEGESMIDFLYRLHRSTTPEEAVTFIAFAARPKMAVWWGYECLINLRSDFSAVDRELLELIARWCQSGDSETRYQIMKIALFAEHRTASVMLGLATGWSGSQIAPNDPSPVPPHRTPRAVNSAVLSALAQCTLANRPHHLARLYKLSEQLVRGA